MGTQQVKGGMHVRSNVQAVEAGQRTARADREAYFRDKIGDGKKVTLDEFSRMDMGQRVMLKQANAAKYAELSDAEDHERQGLGGIAHTDMGTR